MVNDNKEESKARVQLCLGTIHVICNDKREGDGGWGFRKCNFLITFSTECNHKGEERGEWFWLRSTWMVPLLNCHGFKVLIYRLANLLKINNVIYGWAGLQFSPWCSRSSIIQKTLRLCCTKHRLWLAKKEEF